MGDCLSNNIWDVDKLIGRGLIPFFCDFIHWDFLLLLDAQAPHAEYNIWTSLHFCFYPHLVPIDFWHFCGCKCYINLIGNVFLAWYFQLMIKLSNHLKVAPLCNVLIQMLYLMTLLWSNHSKYPRVSPKVKTVSCVSPVAVVGTVSSVSTVSQEPPPKLSPCWEQRGGNRYALNIKVSMFDYVIF